MSNISFKGYLSGQLKDPASKRGFENETTRLGGVIALTKIKGESGLSQQDLATISGVPQPAIVWVKSGANASIDTLAGTASALDKRLTVNFS